MVARLIDGKALAQTIRLEVGDAARAFQLARGRQPRLQLMLVGDDPESARHVRTKERALAAAGMQGSVEQLPAEVTQAAVLARIQALNADEAVDGILLQLPLPDPLDAPPLLAAIAPAKDVDGLTPHNLGLLALGRPRLVPCTALGCLRLIESVGVQLAGAHALVIGRGALVGRPLAHLLLARDATVTIAHSKTRGLGALVARADVVVSAAGVAGLVRAEWIKPGATVVDVGQNRNAQGGLCGDVEPAASERAAFITPVPGGVGPMTVAMLLANLLQAARGTG